MKLDATYWFQIFCGGIATISSTNAKPPPPLAAAAAGARRRGRRTCTRPFREGDAVELQTRKKNRASYSISRGARHRNQNFLTAFSHVVGSLELGRRHVPGERLSQASCSKFFLGLSPRRPPPKVSPPPRGGAEKEDPHRLSHKAAATIQAADQPAERRPTQGKPPGDKAEQGDTTSINAAVVYTARTDAAVFHTADDPAVEATTRVGPITPEWPSSNDSAPEGPGDTDRNAKFLPDDAGNADPTWKLHEARSVTFGHNTDNMSPNVRTDDQLGPL